ncbi:UMTA methyltransferase [Colletotrichum higginsianum IMI 349063]|uniref:UMTA methyltransferase n=1 Tax=Colletotrichum higginsianum (strain IMI 349063) TaxID=759273 RepID=A0A1B7YJU7_COLHI|nr:UMTA methyltransferase [Colletotrichum higginsianum IMI 349063]OBR12300.1 UMTA methyltransferase [Colletotrichum higginsianum IMI 349063]
MASDPQTVPLDNTFLETVTYQGREYQRYAVDNGAYFAPMDEVRNTSGPVTAFLLRLTFPTGLQDEVERLQIMHVVLSVVFENQLLFPPITRPRRILECGFGSGDWAIEVAQRHPSCEVVAIDICPHIWPDETETPTNLNLQVDDLNGRFTFPSNHFDLVHSQMMAGGIHSNRWRDYIGDMFRVTRPGGWCQMVEIYFNAQSDNGTLTQILLPDHALRRWSRRYLDSMQPYKDPRAPLHLQSWMQSAGFDSVETQMIPLPTCGWSNGKEIAEAEYLLLGLIGDSDPRQHHIGVVNRENVRRMLSSLAMYPMTEFRGMTSQEFQVLVAQARSEADNPAFRDGNLVDEAYQDARRRGCLFVGAFGTFGHA